MGKLEEVQRAWKAAAERLGFELSIPYTFHNREFAGFVPHFGGKEGTVFHIQDFSTAGNFEATFDQELEEENIYQSILNYEVYRFFDPIVFKEVLHDWGYFGPEELKPLWYEPAANLS
jgi:hypothetical protein